MISIGIGKTENLLPQVILQQSLALQNFIPGYHIGKSIELWVGMSMCPTFYTTCVDLD